MTDNTSKDNIVSLSGKTREKTKKEAKAKPSDEDLKLNAHQKQALLADWLNGKSAVLNHVKPDARYVLLKNLDQSVSLYRVNESDELLACSQKAVENTIAKAIHNDFRDLELFDLTDRQIDGVARYWEKTTAPLEMPAKIGFQGDPGLVMRRIPCVLADGPTPVWDELMSRITNSDSLMAWFGSLFVDQSNVQQYVWLYGEGNDGKGSIARFFKKVLAHLYSSQEPPSLNDRFWTYGIKDARLVVFEDCNNTSFVTSGFFKSLTGGDWVRGEIKGGAVLSLLIKAKYLFLSNEKPDISSERADNRRIIYCTATPFEGEQNAQYEAALWNEAGAFLFKCLAMYAKLAPGHGPIKAGTDLLDEVVESNEERFSAFLEANFIRGATYRCEPYIMQNLINKEFKTKKEQRDFKAYLTRLKITKEMSRNTEGEPKRYYMRVKPRVMPLTVF